ncbi:MAG: hypothetical protein ABIP30_05485 [Ferruginibacter sp.]
MPQHQLFQKIFKSNLNADGAFELINEVKNEYPFFAVANYYLLKKTQQHSPAYEKIASTTALHFASPFHLNKLLSSTEDALYAVLGNSKAEDDESAIEENPVPVIQEEEPIIEEQPQETITDEPTVAFVQQEETIAEEPTAVITENEIAANEPEENSTEDEFPEMKSEAVENVEAQANVTQEVLPTPAPEENTAPAESNNEPVTKVEIAKEELLFEPLYTTDYFASQGIKLSEAVQSADKLGKQLKSFTDWLKTMKKTHENRLPEGSEQMDKTVQALAEKSNKEDDILTEAMAEAYQQQGKTLKAIEIYSKLSLLNPAKSAFFAAKIDQLK